MMATPVQSPGEPEYGAKVTQENNEAALAAAQPAPGVPLPETPVTGESPVAQAAQQQPAPQQYVTIRNPYMLLPASLNFPQQNPQKTQVEANYDMGLFWQILARDSNNDPRIQEVARSLMGEK